MPKEEYFDKALYTFDIGQNDLGAGFFGNLTVQQVNATVPDIVNAFSKNIKVVQYPFWIFYCGVNLFIYCYYKFIILVIKDIYDLGARSFWIHNTGPISCLPLILANFRSAETDAYDFAKPYNEVAQYFNHKLKEVVVLLRKDLPLAAIIYVNIYSVKYSLFSNPRKYGEPNYNDPILQILLTNLPSMFITG